MVGDVYTSLKLTETEQTEWFLQALFTNIYSQYIDIQLLLKNNKRLPFNMLLFKKKEIEDYYLYLEHFISPKGIHYIRQHYVLSKTTYCLSPINTMFLCRLYDNPFIAFPLFIYIFACDII